MFRNSQSVANIQKQHIQPSTHKKKVFSNKMSSTHIENHKNMLKEKINHLNILQQHKLQHHKTPISVNFTKFIG